MEKALAPKTEVSAFYFTLDVNLEYTLSLRRQKPQKRKNRVGFQIVLQNVNEVQTMGLLLWYNNSRKRRENVKMKIAYVRVSTVEQNEARQIEALKSTMWTSGLRKRYLQKIRTVRSCKQ